jgi:hypothetical protein
MDTVAQPEQHVVIRGVVGIEHGKAPETDGADACAFRHAFSERILRRCGGKIEGLRVILQRRGQAALCIGVQLRGCRVTDRSGCHAEENCQTDARTMATRQCLGQGEGIP